jgi:hypothetical protein
MDSKTEFRIQKSLNYFAEKYPDAVSQGVYNYAWEILELLDEKSLENLNPFMSTTPGVSTLNLGFGNQDMAYIGIYLSSYMQDEDEVIEARVTYAMPNDHHFMETSLLTEIEREEFAEHRAIEIMALFVKIGK